VPSCSLRLQTQPRPGVIGLGGSARDRYSPHRAAQPWEDSPRSCCCGAPGEPCPVCNRVEDDEVPEIPEGLRVDIDQKGWRH
jgi:hypothetical protein